MATKAEHIWDEINALVEGGTAKADAFKQLAESYGQPVDSIRGSYYTHKRKVEGGEAGAKPSRTRRRETSPADALADARAALERAIQSIDRRSKRPRPGPTRPRPSMKRSKRALPTGSRPSPNVWRR